MALSGMSFRINEGVAYDVVSDAPDSVFIQRRLTQATPMRAFEVLWPIVETAEKNAIVADFDAAKGAAGTGTLTHPIYGSLTVRFADEMTVARRTAGRWQISVQVEIDY